MKQKAKSEKAEFVKKPWGGYSVLEKRPDYWLKKLFVDKGGELSLQSHKYRDEIWVVLRGRIEARKGDSRVIMNKGDFLRIKKREKHRILALADACVLEVALGKPRERDIVRYEDKYGRIK